MEKFKAAEILFTEKWIKNPTELKKEANELLPLVMNAVHKDPIPGLDIIAYTNAQLRKVEGGNDEDAVSTLKTLGVISAIGLFALAGIYYYTTKYIQPYERPRQEKRKKGKKLIISNLSNDQTKIRKRNENFESKIFEYKNLYEGISIDSDRDELKNRLLSIKNTTVLCVFFCNTRVKIALDNVSAINHFLTYSLSGNKFIIVLIENPNSPSFLLDENNRMMHDISGRSAVIKIEIEMKDYTFSVLLDKLAEHELVKDELVKRGIEREEEKEEKEEKEEEKEEKEEEKDEEEEEKR
jgi:hypothetical protein